MNERRLNKSAFKTVKVSQHGGRSMNNDTIIFIIIMSGLFMGMGAIAIKFSMLEGTDDVLICRQWIAEGHNNTHIPAWYVGSPKDCAGLMNLLDEQRETEQKKRQLTGCVEVE